MLPLPWQGLTGDFFMPAWVIPQALHDAPKSGQTQERIEAAATMEIKSHESTFKYMYEVGSKFIQMDVAIDHWHRWALNAYTHVPDMLHHVYPRCITHRCI